MLFYALPGRFASNLKTRGKLYFQNNVVFTPKTQKERVFRVFSEVAKNLIITMYLTSALVGFRGSGGGKKRVARLRTGAEGGVGARLECVVYLLILILLYIHIY